jgi:hypothetical protein
MAKKPIKQFKLRIPEDTHARLALAATVNERSITAEILARLEPAYSEGAIRRALRDVLAESQRPHAVNLSGARTIGRLYEPKNDAGGEELFRHIWGSDDCYTR